MSVPRSRLRFEALARRGWLASLLLPGLLLVNLLCFCVHDAAAAAVNTTSVEAAPCHAHDGTAARDGQGSSAPQPQHEGACPHCGEGSALFASPRVASDLASPGAVMIPVAPVGTLAAVEAATIAGPDSGHSPPRRIARNRVLRI